MTQPRHLLVVVLAERFRKSTGHDISRSRTGLHRLLEAVDEAVQELQTEDAVDVKVDTIAVGRTGPLDLNLRLTREEAISAGQVRDVEQLLD